MGASLVFYAWAQAALTVASPLSEPGEPAFGAVAVGAGMFGDAVTMSAAPRANHPRAGTSASSLVLAAPASVDPPGGAEVSPSTAEASQTDKEQNKDETPADNVDLTDIFGTAEEHTADIGPRDTSTDKSVSKSAKNSAAAAPAPSPGRVPSLRGRWGDKLDMRIRILSSAYYDVHKVDKRGFGRNENRLEFYFAYSPDRHVQIVGDIEPVFFGVTQAQELDDLATARLLTPFHLESDAAYIALRDLVPNLDIKIGRQIVVWGTADKFNPTNNINPDDLEDRTLFTEPIANQMVVVDYAPLQDKLWFQGVYVPIFFPALLPPSAAAALKDPQTPVPFASSEDRAKIGRLQDLLSNQPGLVPTVVGHVHQPSRRFTSGQSAIKIGTSLGGVDISASYYNGRHDIVTPVKVVSSRKQPPEGPVDQAQCCFRSDVTLVYPRMQVIGLDFATQLPFLGNMGLWGEAGLFFPQAQTLDMQFPIAIDVTPDDGVANPVMGMRGTSIRSTPFIKATTGFDYTFGKHVYVQAQYVRGMIDEFGAGNLGNYLVAGTDLLFFGRHFIFRTFGVVDLPTGKGDHASYVFYPELLLTPPWGSLTFDLGSFVLLGKPDTKFGQPAAGSSIVFVKVIGQF